MLQITERGFNAPTHGIQPFDFWKGILFGSQIGNNGFAGGIRNWKTNDSERQSIERSRIMLSGGLQRYGLHVGPEDPAADDLLQPANPRHDQRRGTDVG